MSGHMTRMSRGSSVASSASRPSRTSRRTSIWRAGPWQLCTCTERSPGRSVRPSRRTALAVMSDCSQPSSVSGRSSAAEVFVGLRVRRQAALEFAEVAAEGGQQRMSDLAVAGVVAAGDLAVDVGEGSPEAVAGVRQPQVKVVMGRQRVEQFDLGAGQPGVAEQRQPLGQVGGGLLQCGKGFGVPDVRRVGVDAVQQRAPQGRLPPKVGVRCRRRHRFPSRRGAAAVGARTTRRGRRAGAPPRSAGPPQLLLLTGFEVAEVGGQRFAPRRRRSCWSMTSSSGQTSASGCHGSSSVGAGDLGDQGVAGCGTRCRRRRRPARCRGRGCATAAGSATARHPSPGR